MTNPITLTDNPMRYKDVELLHDVRLAPLHDVRLVPLHDVRLVPLHVTC